jgi:hypothetical protein
VVAGFSATPTHHHKSRFVVIFFLLFQGEYVTLAKGNFLFLGKKATQKK